MKTIKITAKEQFSNQDYLKAIDSLNQLGVDKFVAFAKRKNHKEKKDSWFKNTAFCQSLLLRPELFFKIFQLKNTDEILHDYFEFADFIPDFEKQLSIEFPNLLVHSIRVNLSFLNTSREKFYSELILPKEFLVHQKTWKQLYIIDNDIWSKIETLLNKLENSKIELSDILSDLIIYLEEVRFENNTQKGIYQVASIYNLFVDLYLSKQSGDKKLNIESKDSFLKSFMNRFTKPINSNLKELLLELSNWINYRDSILFPYCYDLSITPKELNEIIYFNRTPQSYYRWELDGVRYNLNRLNYHFKGIDIVEYITDTNKHVIPKGKQIEDENGNYQLAIQDWQQRLFLDDLKLNSFIFKGREIDSQTLYKPLITYSKNRNIRYDQGLQKYFAVSKNWKEAYIRLFKDSLQHEIEILPFFLMTKQEYIGLNGSALSHLPKSLTEEIINLFSFPCNVKTKFNRFNINYNVWTKPFIEFGNFLFCPMQFISNNDWFYGFAQAGIENLSMNFAKAERKKSATQMEEYLGELFSKKSWKVHVVNDKEANKINGDVDVIVSDGDNSLLLQLKRTKFRLDLKETYNESINSDRKAIQQLNDAEVSLANNNSIFKIEGKIHKWIVSTSFENVLSEKDGCIKVNYFDLLFALENTELKTLNNLVSFIQEDKGMKKWIELLQQKDLSQELRSLLIEAGLPISLSDPQNYNQPFFANNENHLEYSKRFNKALDLGDNNKIEEAIKMLNTCIEDNPNDYEAWSALANYYADVKNFNDSFKCFDKALEIIPNDPFILRNYAFALRDSFNLKNAFEKFDILSKEYWFVNLD